MSSTDLDPVVANSIPKTDKKSKREKGEHKAKKRLRETEAEPDEERYHKRSKSEVLADGASKLKADKKSKKHKKKHQDQDRQITEDAQEPAVLIQPVELIEEVAVTADSAEDAAAKKRRKREKRERRRREKELKSGNRDGDAGILQASEAQSSRNKTEDDDAMDIDVNPAKISAQQPHKLPEQPYPFFTQRISQYLPLFPLGMVEPIEGYADQHLKPLLNHYVPTFKGVLLAYHDVEIGEAPGKGSITEQSEMSEEVMLESIDEYAAAFGWLTAKVDLFRPSRGAWLEGSVNIHSEGHLGVVCWGMFNASIESGRLPGDWKWVDLLGKGKGKGRDKTPEEAKLPTPEPANEGEEDISQLHTAGYWVNGEGERVEGKLRFQIKNFEVGVSGDYGYLSIEGTMLDEDAEKKKTAMEVEAARRRKFQHGGSRLDLKRLPEFSMTKFGADEEKPEGEPNTANFERQMSSDPSI